MAKMRPLEDDMRQRALAAADAAWEEGSPVIGSRPEDRAKIVEICLRRYRSMNRRHESLPDKATQTRDLAIGVVEATGQDIRQIGPLIVDYEYLAEKILNAITEPV